ncbi:MAG TPA: hypothetical protein VFF06_05755 [Polyangia bacterium]|nr:hypothetical protein [Polyangia bacterium]
MVNINTLPAGDNATLASAYDIQEGSSLDLVVAPDTAGAMVTTSMLPKNAVLTNGIFSFTPDYSQAGLYSVTFTITTGTVVTIKTIGVRVLNVIHIDTPALTVVSEGASAPDITFSSDDPKGTIVNYSADLTNAPGATFDPVAAKLSFSPSFRWLDTKPGALAILVTAEGTEIDTGKTDTSTAKVLYQINEATSFNQELVPIFLLPVGATGGTHPEWESSEGHNCMSAGCHDGTGTAPAGIDFHPNSIYDQLVNHDIAADGINGSTCNSQAALGVKRVTPGSLTKSLWFMKISGTDGAGNPGPPCGVQMAENQPFNWWTVSSQDAWNQCAPTDSNCRAALDCVATDITCKLNARYVRKAQVWIMAGAPKN